MEVLPENPPKPLRSVVVTKLGPRAFKVQHRGKTWFTAAKYEWSQQILAVCHVGKVVGGECI